jgi:hypothetical protein
VPNLCSNHLTVTGPEADVAAFAAAVEGAESICDALLPMPEELRGTTVGSNPDPDEVRQRNIELYGAPDWYEWAHKNWGTKWGDYDTDLLGRQDGLVQYVYTTAWGPLDRGLAKISAQFPTLDFTCVYEESGMCLLGAYRCVDGKIIAESAIGDDEWPDLTTKDGEENWDDYYDAINDLRDRVISDVEVVPV